MIFEMLLICFLVEKEVNELFEELLKDVSITGT